MRNKSKGHEVICNEQRKKSIKKAYFEANEEETTDVWAMFVAYKLSLDSKS